MTSQIIVSCPILPPSANGLHVNVPGKGRVKSSAYTKWRNDAVRLFRSQSKDKIIGPYSLQIEAGRLIKTKRARDLDNIIKPISDAVVKAGLVEDDSLAEFVSARWVQGTTGVTILISGVES